MEKITVNELKGQKLIDYRKEKGQLILNIVGIGERVVACDKCGNIDFHPNRNLRECSCGNKFFVFIDNTEDLKDTLQRLQAEFENYKKRVEKESQLSSKYANQSVIAKLLPVLDSFELALKNTNTDKEIFIKGIQMIYAQLFDVLESEGLIPITTIGKKFDPYYHEVLLQEQSDKEDETVLEELQKGYLINDRVIRFAKVKISKKV